MNTIINFISQNYAIIVLFIAIIIVAIVKVKSFATMPREDQLEQIKGWLLGAVTLAEARTALNAVTELIQEQQNPKLQF